MKRSSWFSALVLSASLCTAALADPITGTVKLDGKAPERKPVPGVDAVAQCKALHKDPVLDESIVADANGNLQNVVVFLKGDNVKGSAPKDPVKLDQKGCQYVPHVIDITVGQDLIATNSDTFLHNVHTLPENSEPSNTAQPTKDENGIKLKPVKAPEIFKVKCDVHPWMGAWVAAFDHPYHNTTAEDGSYEIDTAGLADGTYTIVAWQEKLRESEPQKVTIKGGKPDKAINFTFKQKAAAGTDKSPAAREVALTSLTAGGEKPCCEEGECNKAAAAKATVAVKDAK